MPVPLQRADTDHLTIPMPDDFYVHHALFCIGSTRPGRNGEAVGRWVYEQAKKRSDAPNREAELNTMLDQLVAWAGALKTENTPHSARMMIGEP